MLSATMWSFALEPVQASPPSNDVSSPRPLKIPDAEYPSDARSDGTCLVSVIVDAHGETASPRVIRCTDDIFRPNSLTAVMQYRFSPATRDGKPLPVRIAVEINFVKHSGPPWVSLNNPVPPEIHISFSSPPNTASTDPDANGIYPLTKLLPSSPNLAPSLTDYHGGDFKKLASKLSGKSNCDVLVTIDAKGKPSDAQVLHCISPELEKPALDAILKSHYASATLNGKPVPMRALIRIVYTKPDTDKR